MASITVPFGWIRRVLGRPAHRDGLIFIAVFGDIDAEVPIENWERTSFRPEYALSAYLPASIPAIIASCHNEFSHNGGELADAVWVRARIPAVFAFAPIHLLEEDFKYSIADQTFVACEAIDHLDNWIAYPFICEDYALQTGLRFSPNGPPEPERSRIASAFWNLMLDEPECVHPFRDGYLHDDGHFQNWMIVAYEHGQCIIDESIILHDEVEEFA